MKEIHRLFNRKRLFYIFLIAIICIITLLLVNKILLKKSPLKLGFVNTLSGPASTAITRMRDSVILAVEQINKKGGINGRTVELIIKDDKFDPEEALRVDKELIDEGVLAIIGHSFSSIYVKILPIISKTDVLIINPTAQSPSLKGVDDNLINMNVSLDEEIQIVARFSKNTLKLKKVAVVYDLINQALSTPIFMFYKEDFEKLGGTISGDIFFDSREYFSAPDIVKQIKESDAEGIFIIADAIHAALICQHLRLTNLKLKII